MPEEGDTLFTNAANPGTIKEVTLSPAIAPQGTRDPMITREWIINGAEPHVVQLETRFIAGDVILRIDGQPQASWSIWTSTAPSEPVLIDGVSYSLARVPGLGGRYEFLPTELASLLPRPQRLQWIYLIRAVVAMGLAAAALIATFYARDLLNWYGLPRHDEPLMTMILTWGSAIFAALFLRLSYVCISCRRAARIDGRNLAFAPRPVLAGRLPRDSRYFRPLLTDITATAARWKRHMLGVPNGRH